MDAVPVTSCGCALASDAKPSRVWQREERSCMEDGLFLETWAHTHTSSASRASLFHLPYFAQLRTELIIPLSFHLNLSPPCLYQYPRRLPYPTLHDSPASPTFGLLPILHPPFGENSTRLPSVRLSAPPRKFFQVRTRRSLRRSRTNCNISCSRRDKIGED